MSKLVSMTEQAGTTRQSETFERLLQAASEELDRVGHEVLSIRVVAQRAGVSAATAYTYLASKDRLFAELFWRRLVSHHGPDLDGEAPIDRLRQTTRHLATLIAGAPATAAAATWSLLGTDPEVVRLRQRIGAHFLDRFRAAIGGDADPRVLEAVAMAFFGGLLHAGMGLVTYEALADRLDDVMDVILEGVVA